MKKILISIFISISMFVAGYSLCNYDMFNVNNIEGGYITSDGWLYIRIKQRPLIFWEYIRYIIVRTDDMYIYEEYKETEE